jgi:thiol-disulfide isomerase/thioredoxin
MRTATLSLMTTMAITLIVSSNASAEISWQTNLREAHAQAQGEGKLLLLHFYTDNCTWCDQLEQGSFQEPLVGQAISENFVPVKIHAKTSPKLAEMFKVNRFPTDVILTTNGKTLSHSVSPQNPDRYVTMLTGTLPALDAASEAASLVANGKQATVSEPSPSPSYATESAHQRQAPAQESTRFAMPPSEFGGGAKAQFAGTRSEGMSFSMPGETNAPMQGLNSSVVDAENSQQFMEQPELAMQGFCPVTVISHDKWVEGKPEFGVIHLGKLYLFANEENMSRFLVDPVPYTPVLNEIDVVRFFEERKIVPGKREWGLKDPIHNRMFFFADEAAMNHFYNQYERYTDVAIDVMEKAVKDANPGT